MDISDTLEPNSDQLDAIELIGGPRTFTIEKVSRGNAEQPVQIHLAEFPRPWRPGKSMRRVLVACWGPDASAYVGRRVTLYCDETVRFGSEVVGGTRIKALSHIDKRKQVPLLISRGKSAMFTVEPLTEPARKATGPTAEQIAKTSDRDALKAWWKAHPALRSQIEARVAELDAAPEPVDEPAPLPDSDPADTWPEPAQPGGDA